MIKSKPLPLEYFETKEEALSINKDNGLTWYDTYTSDLDEWKNEKPLTRKRAKPWKLEHLFRSVTNDNT